MIESKDAENVVDTIAKNLIGISKNQVNFQKLPDTFWGYFARGWCKKFASSRFG